MKYTEIFEAPLPDSYSRRNDALKGIKRRGENPDDYNIWPVAGGTRYSPIKKNAVKKMPETSAEEIEDKIEQLEQQPQTPDIQSLIDRLEQLEAKLKDQEERHASEIINTRKAAFSDFLSSQHETESEGIRHLIRCIKQNLEGKAVDNINDLNFEVGPTYSSQGSYGGSSTYNINFGQKYSDVGWGHEPGNCSVSLQTPMSFVFNYITPLSVYVEFEWLHNYFGAKNRKANYKFEISPDLIKKVNGKYEVVDALRFADYIVKSIKRKIMA